MKTSIMPLALACAFFALPARSEYQLPTYTYSIRSGDFTETDILRQSFERVIPGTTWLCSISVITSGLTATCRAPNVRLQTGEEVPSSRVAIRASCASAKAEEQTVHLSDLDGKLNARLSIGCNRLDETDDGF